MQLCYHASKKAFTQQVTQRYVAGRATSGHDASRHIPPALQTGFKFAPETIQTLVSKDYSQA